MTGLGVLAVFLALEVLGARTNVARNVDFSGHFAGLAAGALAAWAIRKEAATKGMTRIDAVKDKEKRGG